MVPASQSEPQVDIHAYIFHLLVLQSLHRLTRHDLSLIKDFETSLVECDGENDHIHLLVNYPTKISITKLVNSLKGVSSRMLKKEFPELVSCYYKGALWTPSYFASSCGGAPLSIIKEYIENQNTPT